jgi:hypothetical protein
MGNTVTDGNGHKVPLKEYVDQRVDAATALLNAKVDATDRAACLANEGLAGRFEQTNQWRQQSVEREAHFLPRLEFDVQHAQIEKRTAELEKYRNQMEGKASQGAVNVAMLLSVAGLLMGLVGLVLAVLHRG